MANTKISIPYSTIKRHKAQRPCEECKTFQFLIVRLKERTFHYRNGRFQISIPYSTIKSILSRVVPK